MKALKNSRALKDLPFPVAEPIRHAIDLLQRKYGSNNYRDSGHANGPTWIFELPQYSAEVGVRMNQTKLSLYMRDRTIDGRLLSDIIGREKIAKIYPTDGAPASSVMNSEFLGPSASNRTLLLELQRDDLEPVFEAFFGDGSRSIDLCIERDREEQAELAKIEKDKTLSETEKQQITLSRIGQGEFRAGVASVERACRVTGETALQHLRASHIKPWCKSDGRERLDRFNGLLLAPHVDHLFDNGYISFDDDGTLLVSPALDKAVLERWRLPTSLKTKAFLREQCAYLAWHRENVLKQPGRRATSSR